MNAKEIVMLAVAVIVVVVTIYCLVVVKTTGDLAWKMKAVELQTAYTKSSSYYDNLNGKIVYGSEIKHIINQTDSVSVTDDSGRTSIMYLGSAGEQFSFYVSTQRYRDAGIGKTITPFGDEIDDAIPAFSDFSKINDVNSITYVDQSEVFKTKVIFNDSGLVEEVRFEEVSV